MLSPSSNSSAITSLTEFDKLVELRPLVPIKDDEDCAKATSVIDLLIEEGIVDEYMQAYVDFQSAMIHIYI